MTKPQGGVRVVGVVDDALTGSTNASDVMFQPDDLGVLSRHGVHDVTIFDNPNRSQSRAKSAGS